MFSWLTRQRWPDFLLIGAQKAGTSFLYDLLCQHPHIAKRPGEVHFFDVHYHLGVDWYKTHFRKKNGEKVIGDKSPYYLYHPLVPQRAFELLPNALLIILLRNPVDRAYSHYWMNRRKNQEELSFEEAIRVENERLLNRELEIVSTGMTPPFSSHRLHSYLARGRYLEQIKKWLAFYPMRQIKIIIYEELKSAPGKVMQNLYPFLGLSNYKALNFEVGERYSYPPMDRATREKLEVYFEPYNQELQEFLEIDLLNKRFGDRARDFADKAGDAKP